MTNVPITLFSYRYCRRTVRRTSMSTQTIGVRDVFTLGLTRVIDMSGKL